MYLEHFWLSVAGIFCAGMLCMLGIILAVDAHEKAKRPREVMGLGFDPGNPINRLSAVNRQETARDDGWYEVRPGEWIRGL